MKWHIRKTYFGGFVGWGWGLFGFGYQIACNSWSDAVYIMGRLSRIDALR